MSVRLRIELGHITEIESVYFRPGGGPNNIADMDKYKSEDIKVLSDGIFEMKGGYRVALVRDPGMGMFVELYEPPKS